MTIESGIALAFATFVFASIPGPGVSALVAQSLSRGFKTGVGYAAGLACGDLVYLLTALFGLGWVSSQIGPWFAVLKWVGAAYLVYMGVKAWMAKPPTEQDTACAPVRGRRSFLAGLCVSLGNPKVIAFYCGFLPGFVHMSELTAVDIVLVVSIIIPTVFMVLATYAWLAGRGRTAIRSNRVWKIANRTAGSIMIGAGAAIVAEQ
ncbi:LysE family translocator [uncultured Pseudodesulfovibrio sp.]|uniref:LysE family translocator n=1 Tax=uncultured Pseudodesulfovibrio sp. TaxID=2035858 RepID=UPI0029C687D0|nr:LysE family translocator [uncultured Pseudodesulfovibrio sp.]